jgi:hypothetical protein
MKGISGRVLGRAHSGRFPRQVAGIGRGRPGLTLFFLCLLFSAALPTRAQTPSRRAAAILQEEFGARRLGIGSAGTALLDDVSALYSNPAGLAASDDYEAMIDLGRTNSRDFWVSTASSIPVRRKATVAIGVGGLRTNNEPDRFRVGQDGFFAKSVAPLEEDHLFADLAVGRLLRPDLSVGAGARYVRTGSTDPREVYEGIYGSFGVRYNSARSGLVIGASVRNFGTGIAGAPDANVPVTSSVGVSYGMLRSTAHYINFALDAVHVENQGAYLRAGVEYWFANFLALRAGFDNAASRQPGNPYEGRVSAGMSVNFSGVMLDLVATPEVNRLEESKIAASLRFSFGEGRRR